MNKATRSSGVSKKERAQSRRNFTDFTCTVTEDKREELEDVDHTKPNTLSQEKI